MPLMQIRLIGPEMLWRGNPARACPPGAMQVVRLFYRHRGGMGPGPLPEAGGAQGTTPR